MSKIKVFHTHIEISDYDIGDEPKLEELLSVWVKTKFCFKNIGFSYDADERVLRVARGLDISILEKLFKSVAEFIYTPSEYDEISIRSTIPPKDDTQREALSFLLGYDDAHKHTIKYSQLLLNISTGAGKTYVSVAATSFFRMKTLVVTPNTTIRKQWVDAYLKFSDCTEDDIYVIDGSKDIERLNKMKKRPFKVYMVNHATLLSYATKHDWKSIGEFFSTLKIGLKIIDEAHKNFDNMMKIDMYTNVKKSIYLTATFARSDYLEERLFKLCTKNIAKFSEKKVVVNGRKHIKYLSVLYNSKPPIDAQAYMFTMRQFNKNRYGAYLETCPKFYEVLEYVLNYFNKVEGKILILTTTISACTTIHQYIDNLNLDRSISEYHSKISKEEKAKAFDADLIISTPASCGVGTDIKGLRVCINTEAYSSSVTADQAAGRLREFNETASTFYVELVDTGFKSVFNMYKRRLPVFKEKCLSLSHLDYDNPYKQDSF